MTEPSQDTHSHRPAESNGNQPNDRTAWLSALIGIVASPRGSFDIIRRRSPWLGAAVFLAAGTMVLTSLLAPFGLQALRTQLTQQMPQEQVEAMMNQFEQTAAATRWLSMATGPTLVVIGILVQAVFVYLLAVAFKGQARFAQSLSLMLHLGVITHLKNWANLLFLHLRGLDAIRSQHDLQTPMGLDVLAGDNAALNAVYASVNPFTIWLLVLLGLGAAAVYQLPRRKGLMLAGLYWAASTALSAGLAGVAGGLLPT